MSPARSRARHSRPRLSGARAAIARIDDELVLSKGGIMDRIRRAARRIQGAVVRLFDNSTEVDRARAAGVRIGRDCRLLGVDFGSEPYLVTLGDHVSASNTAFLTHDGGVWVFRDERPDVDVIRPITVGNNVFLGYGVLILPGVTIGDNVVVGAGAVVTRDIPSDCVAAGVPAKPVRTLAEYRTAVEREGLSTKGMAPEAKRDYLLEHFRRA